MKWIAEIAQPKPIRFVIEQQKLHSLIAGKPDQSGFYIYVYENDRDVYDYLQDTLEIAKGFCLKEFNVPLDAWKQISE